MPLPKAPSKPATLLDMRVAAKARARRIGAAQTPSSSDTGTPTTVAASASARLPEPFVPDAAVSAGRIAVAVASERGTADSARGAGRSRSGNRARRAEGPAEERSTGAAGAAATEAPGTTMVPTTAAPAAALVPPAATAPAQVTPPRVDARATGRAEPRVEPRAAPRAQAASDERKLFVLDTNVLMHDPSSLFRFAEHDVFVPMMTLEEFDNHKRGMSDVSRNARQVSRTLDELIAHGESTIDAGIPLASLGNRDAGGRLFFQTRTIEAELPGELPVGKADNQILGVVKRPAEGVGRAATSCWCRRTSTCGSRPGLSG